MVEYFRSPIQEKEEKTNYFFWGFVISAVFLVIAAVIGIVYYVVHINQFATWKHEQTGISIKYPKEWQPIKSAEGALVVFLSPQETRLDTFQENLNIAVQDLSATPMLFSEFTKIAKAQLEAVFNNITVIQSKDIMLDQRRAHRLEFIAQSEQPLRVLIVWFMKGDIAFTLTFMSEAGEYKKYKPYVNEMINSFKLEKMIL